MKKILGFILAGTLSLSYAEQSGFFAGTQFGLGKIKVSWEERRINFVNNEIRESINKSSREVNGYLLGLLAGYKQFFTHKFGLRYYGLFNYGSYQGLNGTDFSVKNLNVNCRCAL